MKNEASIWINILFTFSSRITWTLNMRLPVYQILYSKVMEGIGRTWKYDVCWYEISEICKFKLGFRFYFQNVWISSAGFCLFSFNENETECARKCQQKKQSIESNS